MVRSRNRGAQSASSTPLRSPDLTTVTHALSAALIAATALHVPPSESRYLVVAALVAGSSADADQV